MKGYLPYYCCNSMAAEYHNFVEPFDTVAEAMAAMWRDAPAHISHYQKDNTWIGVALVMMDGSGRIDLIATVQEAVPIVIIDVDEVM